MSKDGRDAMYNSTDDFSRALLSFNNSGNSPVDVTLEWIVGIEAE